MRSILDPPPRAARARFDATFGQRFLLTVDGEEESEWSTPPSREEHGLHHVHRLEKFQKLCESEGVRPVYLVGWPVAQSRLAARILRSPLVAGQAEIGIQPGAFEQARFVKLREAIETNFEVAPIMCRAGLNGVAAHSGAMIAAAGIAIDSSVRANFDYRAVGGPDFSRHPLDPYWLDDGHTLLELPLTAVYWGMLRRQGPWIYPALARTGSMRAILARLGLLERIPLSPDGVSVDETICGIDMALDDGLPLLVLAVHSGSLRPGHAAGEDDLDDLYDWLRRVLAYLELRKVAPTTVREVMAAVLR